MNKKILSLNNYFVSENINRNSLYRTDDIWLKNKLNSDSALVIPVSNLKFLITKNERRETVFFKPELFKDFFQIGSNFIFLGDFENMSYFCVNINELQIPQDFFTGYGEFKELRSIAPLINHKDASLLAYSRALVYWHNTHKYCGVCGSPTEVFDGGFKRICKNKECRTEHFPRTDPAIIVLVSYGDKCLLARQSKWRPKQYATIAGFVEPGESLEQAVAREVFEETAIELDEIWYRSSQPWPFPAAIMLGFRATAKTSKISLLDNELEDAQWFTREEIKSRILDNTIRLPFGISISFRLVEEWFNEGNEGKLSELLSSLDPAKR